VAHETDSAESVFFELALEDMAQAAELFRPIYERTGGVDGWVSLEVSPLLAHDTARTIAAARDLHQRLGQPNLFIKIPGTKEGLLAVEEAIFAGVSVNATLLFSHEHYFAAAAAYQRGLERRVALGLDAGARPQRLLFASTGTKDPDASDVLYIESLAAASTVNTMPEATQKAFADHGRIDQTLPVDGGDCELVLGRFAAAGVDLDALAAELQRQGAEAFIESWNGLLERLRSKGDALQGGSGIEQRRSRP
jgi:transaldolase